jgi:hypothetical protein
VELPSGPHAVHLGLDFDLAPFVASKRITPALPLRLALAGSGTTGTPTATSEATLPSVSTNIAECVPPALLRKDTDDR